ncbi:hypothetical protein SLA2020_075240 [Shorea laevis]
MVKEMGKREVEEWKWQMEWRQGRIVREKGEERVLWEVLDNVQLKEGVEDCWKWKYDAKGRYLVKKAYDFLAPMECLLEGKICKLVWCKLVPSKVNFFGWRLCLDRLPTRGNLLVRGVLGQGNDLRCGLCHEELEDVNHLFCTYQEAWAVWVKVFNWWGLQIVIPDTVKGMVELFLSSLGRIADKEVIACIFLVGNWFLWYWRNVKVFGGEGDFKEQLLDMIQSKSFFWIKHKTVGGAFSFSQWQLNPVECAKETQKYKRCLKAFHHQQQPHD